MNAATPLQLVSFDLDGTLVDTAHEIAAAANWALAQHGVGEVPVAEVRRHIGEGGRALILSLLARAFMARPELIERVRPEAVMAGYDQAAKALAGRLSRPYPGAQALLADLRRRGVHTACVSNKESLQASRLLHVHGLDIHLERVVGGDTWPWRKPDRRVLRRLAASFGVTPDRCVHVGDSAVDVDAAREAGFAAWAVRDGSDPTRPVDDARPHRLFDNLADLLAQLRAVEFRVLDPLAAEALS